MFLILGSKGTRAISHLRQLSGLNWRVSGRIGHVQMMSFADAAARLLPHHHGQRVGSSELGLLVLSELVGAYIQGVLPEMQLRGVPFPCAAL